MTEGEPRAYNSFWIVHHPPAILLILSSQLVSVERSVAAPSTLVSLREVPHIVLKLGCVDTVLMTPVHGTSFILTWKIVNDRKTESYRYEKKCEPY